MRKEYQKGDSITDHVGSGRIISLKKDNTYQKAYPVMNGIGLFSLNYLHMPKEDYLQANYVIQVISRYIKDTLMSFHNRNIQCSNAKDESITFIQSILGSYAEDIKFSRVFNDSDNAAAIACKAFRLDSCYCIQLNCMDSETVYGAVGMKRKRKAGYYYEKGNRLHAAHIIDLVDFLAKIFLLLGIHQIRSSIKLPLVQNVFEEYLNEVTEITAVEERHVFAKSIRNVEPLSLRSFFSTYTSKNREFFYVGSIPYIMYDAVNILRKVLEIYNDICYENRHRSEISRSIATAYITKKNIPQLVQNAMKETRFMDHFKFVEFDEEVDLKSVKAIEKEFEILNNAYFMGKSFKDVTLRFRKLGKHKASGLYYPTLRTLCVDIRHPSSFIHEYFHMIDDQLGDLSLEVSFNRITDLYKDAFTKQIDYLNNSIQNTLNGKSKYNIQYFFRRAEIFARCGEIYFSRILNVESSLMQLDLTYAYPKSDDLDKAIKYYYEFLLTKRLSEYKLSEAI